MSSYNVIAEKDSVASEHEQEADVEQVELRATVELETQAKVDTDHPDVNRASLTLEQEERMAAHEQEIARTRRRFDSRDDSGREARTRQAAVAGSRARRRRFAQRAASVDPQVGPETADPREALSCEALGAVNEQAVRIAAETRESSSRAAIARQLAERVAAGDSVVSASIAVLDAERTQYGTVVPIGELEEIPRHIVSIEGTVTTLWESSSPKIQQVGLIEDDSGRVKWTAWKRSQVTPVRDGETVRFRAAAKSWYQGRCSVALTGDSRVVRI